MTLWYFFYTKKLDFSREYLVKMEGSKFQNLNPNETTIFTLLTRRLNFSKCQEHSNFTLCDRNRSSLHRKVLTRAELHCFSFWVGIILEIKIQKPFLKQQQAINLELTFWTELRQIDSEVLRLVQKIKLLLLEKSLSDKKSLEWKLLKKLLLENPNLVETTSKK